MVIESAQRLIAVSLGKMASSRNQRGGVRLHRSLLVAGVLMNARSASSLGPADEIVEDQYTANKVNDADLLESTEIDAGECDALTPLLPPTTAESLISADDVSEGVREVADAAELSLECVSPETTTSTSVAPVAEHDSLNKIFNSLCTAECERKRKRLEDDKEIDYSVEVKRSRSVSDSESSCIVSSQLTGTDSFSSKAGEEMEIDSVQLSSLVHCFNSGFQGLLSSSTTVDTSSALAFTLDSCSDGRHHASTSESIISCSIHIREALETLSRPVLAMSV